MSNAKCAFSDLVATQIARQRSMSLPAWPSDTLMVESDAKIASEIYMLSKIAPLFEDTDVESVSVSATRSDYVDSSYGVSVTVSVTLPDGGELDISHDEDIPKLDDLIEQLEADEDLDPDVLESYQLTRSKLVGFFTEFDDNELAHSVFWDKHGEFELGLWILADYRKEGRVDYLALAHQVFGRRVEAAPMNMPPERWTGFELDRMEERLDAGMHVDAWDQGGMSALNAAVYHGRADLVGLLLFRGANPNAADASALTPVVTAVHRGEKEILAGVVAAGGDLNGPMSARSALFSLNSDGGVRIAELLDMGLDIHVALPDGRRLSDDPRRYAPHLIDVRVISSELMAEGLDSAMSTDESRVDAKPSSGMGMSL